LSRLILFPDTNVFLQCRALHEVPWGDTVQADEIALLIGAQVQDEIDRLKGDGNSRRARRARETNSLFRSALASPDESLPLRESAPKVTLRFAPALPQQRESAETLDLTRSDDQLLDEVMHFRRTEPSAQILSGDTGMMLRARRLGVPLIPVPESWLLPPEKDDRDRQIGALRAEVAGLRSAEALLSLSLDDERSRQVETIAGSLPLYRDLTAEEVNGLIRAVERSHPEVKAFGSSAPAAKAPEGLGALGPLLAGLASFRAPSTDQIARYHDDYEEWIGRARKLFEQLGPSLNIRHRIYKLRVALANTSSRPADEVLLELKVHGNVTLLASVGDNSPDLIAQAEKLPSEVVLPSPPSPPKGEYFYEALARNAQFGQRDLASALHGYMPDYSGIRSSFKRRDRHEFYRREDDDRPTTEASFACEEFRHQRAPEVFTVWVVTPLQGEIAKARLHIRASARNMNAPVDLYVPIDIDSESRSTYEIAANWRTEE
jgi:hypothetical protein